MPPRRGDQRHLRAPARLAVCRPRPCAPPRHPRLRLHRGLWSVVVDATGKRTPPLLHPRQQTVGTNRLLRCSAKHQAGVDRHRQWHRQPETTLNKESTASNPGMKLTKTRVKEAGRMAQARLRTGGAPERTRPLRGAASPARLQDPPAGGELALTSPSRSALRTPSSHPPKARLRTCGGRDA